MLAVGEGHGAVAGGLFSTRLEGRKLRRNESLARKRVKWDWSTVNSWVVILNTVWLASMMKGANSWS
jgi:hypothetical protein